METAIYTIGLIVAGMYIILSFDDLIWDIITLFTRNRSEKIKIDALNEVPPKLLAIGIAAWHEENVIGDVIDHLIASVQYPKSMYYVFLGAYPNDEKTIAVAKQLEETYPNVIMVVNENDGPTNKADNINSIIAHMHRFETERGWEFASITVHDSEDVVHPYEFKVTNYLLNRYEILQFPVFPLQNMPKLSNMFKNMTVGTYADEFAENHFRTMSSRDNTNAFVPSAGTGFVISKTILEKHRYKDLFPENSLTEDYKLSLTLAQEGNNVHYVLEKVPRLNDSGKVVWEYISTRSMFPLTFKAAVKQKTRWVYGITMQSFRFSEIFTTKNISRSGRYFMYKDLKAKIANLTIFPGYAVFIYFIVSLFISIPVMYPMCSFSWWLCVFLTFLMIERQILRAVAIKNVYGWKSVFIACLLPPILPIRLVWGNIINFTATFRAWKQYFFRPKTKSHASGKEVWAKTDHEFLKKNVLQRYYRTVGDILLEKQYIDAEMLKTGLGNAELNGRKIGEELLSENMITEEQLTDALAFVHHTLYFPIKKQHVNQEYAALFDRELLTCLTAFPILLTRDGFVIAFSHDSPEDAASQLEKRYNIKVHTVYSTNDRIEKALEMLYSDEIIPFACSIICQMYYQEKIEFEQILLVYKYNHNMSESDMDILSDMGLYQRIS